MAVLNVQQPVGQRVAHLQERRLLSLLIQVGQIVHDDGGVRWLGQHALLAVSGVAGPEHGVCSQHGVPTGLQPWRVDSPGLDLDIPVATDTAQLLLPTTTDPVGVLDVCEVEGLEVCSVGGMRVAIRRSGFVRTVSLVVSRVVGRPSGSGFVQHVGPLSDGRTAHEGAEGHAVPLFDPLGEQPHGGEGLQPQLKKVVRVLQRDLITDQRGQGLTEPLTDLVFGQHASSFLNPPGRHVAPIPALEAISCRSCRCWSGESPRRRPPHRAPCSGLSPV